MNPTYRTTYHENRNAWLQARNVHGRIGSSSVAAVLGVSPWEGPWDVYLRNRDFDPDAELNDDNQTADMARGHYWEPHLAKWYADRTDAQLTGWGDFTVHHPQHAWLVVSPDELVLADYGVVEIKTQRYRNGWGADGEIVTHASPEALGTIPPYYLVQAYTLLAACEAEYCDFVVGFSFSDIRVIRVMADPKYQARLVSMVAAWRQRHVIDGVQPPYDDSAASRGELLTFDRQGHRFASPEEQALLIGYVEAQGREKQGKADREAARNILIRHIAESGVNSILMPDEHGKGMLNKRGHLKVTGIKGPSS